MDRDMKMIPASSDIIDHHLKNHLNDCEIQDPYGVWLFCPDRMFAVVCCMGCFSILFTGAHPDPDKQCCHTDAFFEHLERQLPPTETEIYD